MARGEGLALEAVSGLAQGPAAVRLFVPRTNSIYIHIERLHGLRLVAMYGLVRVNRQASVRRASVNP